MEALDGFSEHSFFEHIFLTKASALPLATWNAMLISPFTVLAFFLEAQYGLSAHPTLLTPFSVLVGLMISSRMAEAYTKYREAFTLFTRLHTRAMQTLQRLIALTPKAKREEAAIILMMEQFRRHLVLACCLVMQSLRDEKSAKVLRLIPGLMTAEEERVLCSQVVSFSPIDNKMDRFPSRNRPALVFLWLHEAVAELSPLIKMTPPAHTSVDSLISTMGDLFEEAEQLARLGMPAPYAQVNRLTILCFLVWMPFSLAKELGMLLIPAMLVAHTIYFGLERAANMMENPFGYDTIDLDLEKVMVPSRTRLATLPPPPLLSVVPTELTALCCSSSAASISTRALSLVPALASRTPT